MSRGDRAPDHSTIAGGWAFALPGATRDDPEHRVRATALALYEAAMVERLALDRSTLSDALGEAMGLALADLLDACHELVDC